MMTKVDTKCEKFLSLSWPENFESAMVSACQGQPEQVTLEVTDKEYCKSE